MTSPAQAIALSGPARAIRGVIEGLLLACVFVLAFTRIEDTDAWTHLALGRHLVALRGFPAAEPFSFAGHDLPYYNPEWLFDLLLYLVWASAGLPGVILLKAALAAAVFLVLFRAALLPRSPGPLRALDPALALLVLLPVALAVRHRFVERPDLALMLFLPLTIYALDAYVLDHRARLLALLPLVQLLWVNVHPSVVLVAVPFLAHLAGGTLQLLLARRGLLLPGTPSLPQLRTLALVFLAVLAASLLNPYGVDPFFAPFRFAAAPWLHQEILELRPPRFPEDLTPFVLLALLVLAFLLTLRRLCLTSLFLVLPFIHLALSARRFVFLLAVVAAPVLARHLRQVIAAVVPDAWLPRLRLPAAALAVALALGLTVPALLGIEPIRLPLKQPGIGVNTDAVPEGALRYLDRVGITGRVLNTFHWGGYLTWRDFPQRAASIDGRLHARPEVLRELKFARAHPEGLGDLRRRYGFEVAILDYPRSGVIEQGILAEVDIGLPARDWALVYWDDLALVYVWREGSWAHIARRDEYRFVKPANGGSHLARQLGAGVPFAALEGELRRSAGETGSSIAYALLGFLENHVGLHERAIATFLQVRDFPLGSHLHNAEKGLGYAYWMRGDVPRAVEHYKRALRFGEDPVILYNLALAYERLGDPSRARAYFREALRLAPTAPWAPRARRAIDGP